MQELECVDCPLCNLNNFKIHVIAKDYLFSKKEFTVVRCESCGLIFTNPRVKENLIAHYYFSDYIQHREITKLTNFQRAKNSLGYLFKNPYKKILKALRSTNAKTVLEVGAGEGSLLNYLKKNGLNVTGVERDRNCVRRIRAMDITCYSGDLNEVVSKIGFKKFDAVVFHHAFEHLYNPKKTLSNIYNLLNEKGIIYLSVPNINSIEARLFGKYWKGLDLPRHTIHYDINSIKKFLSEAKFKIINLESDIFPSSFIESIGFFLLKQRMPLNIYYLFYYPWKLLAPIHTKVIGSGVMSVVAKKC